MKTKTIKEIKTIINNNNSFLITSHYSPDGDALGSVIALGLLLKKLHKEVFYHIDRAFADKYSFLTDIEDLKNNIDHQKFDVGICLDCGDLNHLFGSEALDRCSKIVNIDHHKSNTLFGTVNYVDIEASATGEIIYELLEHFKISLNIEMAIALYTAIVTDTGNFKYSNTTSKTHLIVSNLLRHSFKHWEINKKLFDEHKKTKILLMGETIKNLNFYFDGKIALSILTQAEIKELGALDEDVEGLINIGRDISGVEVSVFIKETKPSEYKVGFRSNNYVDVGEIALELGGGGHSRAAGCTILGNKDEIINNIINILSKKI
ncbi:MAG TPA: bifunctional oligoribonuclease/PAP phosphatase NrnA [Eubacteriaceae bacterium]|nr:bifunctional oligoribonuclease/PAP phosphatase NrnA [Eubacteriaceae bacterium]